MIEEVCQEVEDYFLKFLGKKTYKVVTCDLCAMAWHHEKKCPLSDPSVMDLYSKVELLEYKGLMLKEYSVA